jgi:hypothetical protein
MNEAALRRFVADGGPSTDTFKRFHALESFLEGIRGNFLGLSTLIFFSAVVRFKHLEEKSSGRVLLKYGL